MAYCYECGEQVAENDTFCPYCGISLQPLAVGGEEEDDSMSKTIVGQPPPSESALVAEMRTEAAEQSEPAGGLNDVQLKERLGGGNAREDKDESFADNITEDNLNPEDDQPETIPAAPPFFEEDEDKEFERFFEDKNVSDDDEADKITQDTLSSQVADEPRHPSESSPSAKTSTENAEGKSAFDSDFTNSEPTDLPGVKFEFSLNNANLEKSDSDDEPGASAALPNESLPVSDEAAEVKEELSVNDLESSSAAVNQTGEIADDIIEPAANKLEDSSVNEDFPAVDSDFKDDAPQNFVSAEKSEQISPFSENYQSAEQPIVMPEADLPVAESFPPSKFDSVSIMEKPEDVAEPTEKPVSANLTGAPAQTAAVAEEPKEARSYTAPIAGSNDTDGKNKTKLKPLDEGTILNARYEIIRKIGGGGMGAVYLASDKNLGGVLRAVKEMVQSYIEDEQQEKAVNDFKRESLLLTSLDHQSIPTIYDYFFDETEARFYLVMKYISGGDLAGRLRSAPESRIEEASVTEWAIQIADVLDYLHNRQPPIVYRDLKPANIMVDGNSGRVMLIDFGIARWVNKEEKGVTAVGTMGYAPPELFSGNVEARSDIYSLGSTMFHLLTGADPQSNPLLIFDFQKHPRPRQINSQLSDQMERILMRAVEYNADKRFDSAAEMKKALEEHLENLKSNRATFGIKEAPQPVGLSDQPVFCGFCGQKIMATDMFCAFCGSKQPLAQQGVHSENYSPVPLTAQLLIIGTNELEHPAFKLDKEDNLVGRRDPMSNIFPEVDLSKFDPQTKISRRHARIWREGNEFMVEDLGSSNGTYLLPVISDTMRLQPHQPQLLTNGDKLRLGDTTLHFILG